MSNNYDYLWKDKLSLQDNLYHLLKDYIPFTYNVFSCKTHIEEATQLIRLLEHQDLGVMRLYDTFREYRNKCEKETGEFKKRLDYAVEKMESINPFLKSLEALSTRSASLMIP